MTLSLRAHDGDRASTKSAGLTELESTAFAYDYDPYGVPTLTHYSGGEAQPINPYQFKGGIHDRTTDWVKFGHRWYSTGTGRFTQRDTLDAPLDPANANRYTVAANDPINNTDPRAFLGSGCLSLFRRCDSRSHSGGRCYRGRCPNGSGTIVGLPAGADLGAATSALDAGAGVSGVITYLSCN